MSLPVSFFMPASSSVSDLSVSSTTASKAPRGPCKSNVRFVSAHHNFDSQLGCGSARLTGNDAKHNSLALQVALWMLTYGPRSYLPPKATQPPCSPHAAPLHSQQSLCGRLCRPLQTASSNKQGRCSSPHSPRQERGQAPGGTQQLNKQTSGDATVALHDAWQGGNGGQVRSLTLERVPQTLYFANFRWRTLSAQPIRTWLLVWPVNP